MRGSTRLYRGVATLVNIQEMLGMVIGVVSYGKPRECPGDAAIKENRLET